MYQPRYRETVTGVGAGSTESRDVSSLLQSLESDLKRYQQSVTVLGTSQDDANIREELVELRSAIKNKFSTASNDINQQQQTATARDRVALDKLSKQLQQQLHRYKQIVSDHDKRRANYPLQTTGGYDYDNRSGGSQRYHSSQQMVSLQAQEQDVEQREREAEELRALERDIVDLNEVFKDVAVMVNEQGEDINRIEANVEQAGTRVERGNSQLSKAAELVKSNRKLRCCLLITCIIIIIVILLVIIIPIAVTQSGDD